jgi:hypothetical protein
VIVVIVLAFFFLRQGGDPEDSDRLRALESRLRQMEQKAMRLERQGAKITKLEEEFKNYALKMMDRVDSIEKSLALIRKRVAERPRPAPVQKAEKPQAQKPAATERTVREASAERRYHTVRPGENLYRIGLQYGLTVRQLRGINNLGPGALIQPGQKLLVTRPGK